MKKVLRMIPNDVFIKIRDGEYKYRFCSVYYGFDCYRDDPQYINDIAKVIKDELQDITNDLMHISCITSDQSVTHVNFTTIRTIIEADDIKKNLSAYTIL